MSAVVRIYSHAGLTTAFVAAGTRYTTDSVGMLKQPYLGRESITANTSTAQSSATATAPDSTKLLHVQIEVGKKVHIEVNPPNRSTAADTNSPVYSGNVTLEAGPSWTLSVLEAS